MGGGPLLQSITNKIMETITPTSTTDKQTN